MFFAPPTPIETRVLATLPPSLTGMPGGEWQMGQGSVKNLGQMACLPCVDRPG